MTATEWLLNANSTPEDSSDLYEYYDDYCMECGHISSETFKRYCRKAVQAYRDDNVEVKKNPDVDVDVLLDRLNETDNKLELSLKSYKIQDVETAAQIAGIDLSQWKCTRKTVRASQNQSNPWFIVEGKFEKIPEDEISTEELVEQFKKILEEHTPPEAITVTQNRSKTDNTVLINIIDQHIGKKVQGDVTGNGIEWTTELAKESMIKAVDYFIERTVDEADKVVFVLGNDLLNIDNPQGTTTKGTPQKNDIDLKHLVMESTDLLITVLEKLLVYYSNVEVIVVPGNHDNNMAFMVGEMIRRYFTNTEHLQINNSLSYIKYWQYGENAVGFVHGSEQIKKKYVLPMLMLQQKPEFAKCRYKEFHSGHLHQTKKSQLTEIEEDYGVTLRTLPTLSPTCEWASEKGYMGIQATECIVYNKEKGPIITHRYGG